jgi:heat shock protein HtpX
MARTRFVPDTGLTVRMTSVMFLLGAIFVALVVALMFVLPSGWAPIIGVIGIGIAWGQWYFSDTVAMKAMRAREVTPEQAPELHGMIDRLCALADMPKPRVGVADLSLPNAFATGRSPERSVVCVTTGILGLLTADEMEAVLAHELSHVAHRDVTVMTIASTAGIVAGMLTRGAQYGAFFGGGGRRDNNNNNTGGVPVWLVVLVVSLVVYAVSFFLTRLLSRYRELCADRSGAYLTLKPQALASALQKIAGNMNAIPERDLRSVGSMNAFFISPAVKAGFGQLTSTHPSLEQRLEQLSRIQAELSRNTDGPVDPGDAGGLPPAPTPPPLS